MKPIARIMLVLILLCMPAVGHAQVEDAGATEEKAAGKPFYGYAGFAALAFGALYGACRASRR